MKFLTTLFLFIFVISTAPVYSQTPNYDEVIEKSNRIIKSIYDELWRIRNSYGELKDFCPDNYSDTPELPAQYQRIKSIRIVGGSENERTNIFKNKRSRGGNDIIYICFSDQPKAFGMAATPFFGIKMKELGLYIIVYANTENDYLKRAVKSIVTRNAIVTEQISY
ncbi:MAG: hypothetical protein WCY05_07910 [Candidatus Omnitrophota bacterium]